MRHRGSAQGHVLVIGLICIGAPLPGTGHAVIRLPPCRWRNCYPLRDRPRSRSRETAREPFVNPGRTGRAHDGSNDDFMTMLYLRATYLLQEQTYRRWRGKRLATYTAIPAAEEMIRHAHQSTSQRLARRAQSTIPVPNVGHVVENMHSSSEPSNFTSRARMKSTRSTPAAAARSGISAAPRTRASPATPPADSTAAWRYPATACSCSPTTRT